MTRVIFEELKPGDVFISPGRTVTETDVAAFAGLSGDYNPLHTDAVFMKSTPFGERIAHGMLVVSIAIGMANWLGALDGKTAELAEQVIRYKSAVKFGDTIHLELTFADKQADRVTYDMRVVNHTGQVVVEGKWVVKAG